MPDRTPHPLDPRVLRERARSALRAGAPVLTGITTRATAIGQELGARVAAAREEASPALSDLSYDLGQRAAGVKDWATDAVDWCLDLAEELREACAEAREAQRAEHAQTEAPSAQEVAAQIGAALREAADKLEHEDAPGMVGHLNHLDQLTVDGKSRGRVVTLAPDQVRFAAAVVERLVVDGRVQAAA